MKKKLDNVLFPVQDVVGCCSYAMSGGEKMVVDGEKIDDIFANSEIARHVAELEEYIRSSAKEGCAVHQVEKGIWHRVLSLGFSTLKMFFHCVGDGDVGEEVELPDGARVRRLPLLHSLEYQSIFGLISHKRVVYGTREGQKIKCIPFDARLRIPASKFSYVLQDWDQSFVVEESYAGVSQRLSRILGFSQAVGSLELMNRRMAEPVPEFWDSLPVPAAETEGELMVCSGDGKGVPIRCPVPEPPIDNHRPKQGPKPNRKKMALLGAVYTVDAFPRTPEAVVDSLFRATSEQAARDRKRPKPRNKRVRASLARSECGTTQPALDEIFGWMAHEVQVRDEPAKRRVIALMDGQETLWQEAEKRLPKDHVVEILDLLHVTPRLWKAAYIFHPQGSKAAVAFVRDRVLRVLRGKVSSVTKWMRWMANYRRLRGKKREELEKICRYLENNKDRMRYDEYLAAGYPIATGVIEGACRHLVKDRMERAGMRWVLQGAQSMLHLRSIHISGLWDDFTAYRIKKETERLYPYADSYGPLKLVA